MKPCPHCGKELPQEMQFCPYCMEKLITETVIGDTPVRRRRRWWLWLVVLLLLLLFLWGLWLFWLWRHPANPPKGPVVSLGGNVTATTDSTIRSTAQTTAASGTTTATQTTTTTASKTATTNQTTTTTASKTTTTTQTKTTTTSGIATTRKTTVAAKSTTAHTTLQTSTTSHAPSATDPCAVTHTWDLITQTVHHDEVGHYETKMVEKRVTLYRCALCYKEFGVLEDYYTHFDTQHDGDSLEIVFRDRYETFAEYREVEEQQWVVDTPAHDKTITVGRRCRVCGKTETYQEKE